MEYKALITRQIGAADEAIRIQIENDTDFSTFKERVLEACQLGDYRANLQMQRLFEDTDLTSKLTPDELTVAEQAAKLLYPIQDLPTQPSLNTGTRFEFTKQNTSGEAVVLQIFDVESYNDLNDMLNDIWALIDARLIATNTRQLQHMQYIRSLPYEVQLKVGLIMEILYGRAFTEQVIERLKQTEEDTQLKDNFVPPTIYSAEETKEDTSLATNTLTDAQQRYINTCENECDKSYENTPTDSQY